MRSQIAHNRLSVTLMGALLIFLGATILVNARGLTTYVARLSGFACATYGVVSIGSRLLRASERDEVPFVELASAGVLMLAGAMLALYPGLFTHVLLSLFGMLIIFSGVGDILRARALKADAEQEVTMSLRIGIVTVAVGVFVTLMPLAAASMLPIACGIALVADGLSELYLALTME